MNILVETIGLKLIMFVTRLVVAGLNFLMNERIIY